MSIPQEGMSWSSDNFDVFPPDNEWFKCEFYLSWGDGVTDGNAWWKINGELVYEHHGRMTVNDDNLAYLFITQLYGGNSHPQSHYVDDIEIWDGIP